MLLKYIFEGLRITVCNQSKRVSSLMQGLNRDICSRNQIRTLYDSFFIPNFSRFINNGISAVKKIINLFSSMFSITVLFI